ncbi:MAG: translocation/assembly module TamB domain-containing protein, partial [bacterium]
RASLGGTIKQPEISADVEAVNVLFMNFPAESINGRLTYINRQVILENMHLNGQIARIDSQHPIFNTPGIRGGFKYNALFSGPVKELRGELSGELFSPGFNNFAADSGHLHAVMEAGNITIDTLCLWKKDLMTLIDLRFKIPFREVKTQISFYRLTEKDSLAPQRPEISKIRYISEPCGVLNIGFSPSAADTFLFETRGSAIEIGIIKNIFPTLPLLNGRAGLELRAHGTYKNPSADLFINCTKPTVMAVGIDSIIGSAAVRDHNITVSELTMYYRQNVSRTTASIGLRKNKDSFYSITTDSPLEGQLSADNLNLEIIAPFLSESLSVAGICSYGINYGGSLNDFHLNGQVMLNNGMAAGPGFPGLNNIRMHMIFKDTVIDLKELSAMVKGIPVNLTGKSFLSKNRNIRFNTELIAGGSERLNAVGVASSDSFNVRVQSRKMVFLPFSTIMPSLAGVDGHADADILIHGHYGLIRLDGKVKLAVKQWQPAWMDVPFTQGEADLDFNRNHITVEKLAIRLGDGSMTAGGTLKHMDGKPDSINLWTKMQDITIKKPKQYVLGIDSAQIVFKTKDRGYLIQGDIVLGQSRFLRNIGTKDILAFVKKKEKVISEPDAFSNKTELDVRIGKSSELWIDNNLAKMQIHSELSLIGTLAGPGVTGRTSIVQGYVMFLDRKFRIERGTADFTDRFRINPEVDIRAVSNVKSYEAMQAQECLITLSITGPADAARVELISEPPLDKPDIISILATGATRSQLTGFSLEMREGNILLERLGNYSTQKLSGYVSRNVGSRLGLDKLSIEGNLFRFDKSWGPQLLASKRISRRMEITYTTNAGHLNENSIKLNYMLSNHWSLESQTDQKGDAGLDIKYGIKFK